VKDPNNDLKLVSKFLKPPGTRTSFIYPAGFHGWALATGRITAYPAQINTALDFDWLKQIGREKSVREKLDRIKSEDSQPLGIDKLIQLLDTEKLYEKLAAGTAQMGDLFQDWEGGQLIRRYKQFIDVPVPIIDRANVGAQKNEYGVFNIDSPDDAPLLTTQSELELGLLSDMVQLCYMWNRFG
jgi:hypothetical protein